MTVYKFFTINKNFLKSLVKKQLWVADPFTFNDPFEFCKRSLHNITEKGLEYISPEEAKLKEFIEKHSEEFGVICFTKCDWSNSLMWSHYGDEHKGVCLAFEINEENLNGVHDLNYEKSLPKFDYSGTKDSIRNNLLKIALTKSEAWSHENECRQLITDKNVYHKYPGKLKQVLFGCRCPEEDIQLIWNLLIPIYESSIQFGKTKMQEGTFNLSLALHPLENKLEELPVVLQE